MEGTKRPEGRRNDSQGRVKVPLEGFTLTDLQLSKLEYKAKVPTAVILPTKSIRKEGCLQFL